MPDCAHSHPVRRLNGEIMQCPACGASPAEQAESLPVRPCVCGHPKGDHRRRMDECQIEGCWCPLWAPLPEGMSEPPEAVTLLVCSRCYVNGAVITRIPEDCTIEHLDGGVTEWRCPTHGVVFTRLDGGELDLGLIRPDA